MIVKPPQINGLLKHLYDEPFWLGVDERLDIRADIDMRSDGYMLRGVVYAPEIDDTKRFAEVPLEGSHLARLGTSKGALVDLLRSKLEALLELLEPPQLPDHLMNLALEAWWGENPEESLDVLADAALERGDIEAPYRGLRKRADTRTDDEKAADLRAELHRKTKAWARPFVEILFRRNWSTKPWATDPLRLAGHAVVSRVGRGEYTITFDRPLWRSNRYF